MLYFSVVAGKAIVVARSPLYAYIDGGYRIVAIHSSGDRIDADTWNNAVGGQQLVDLIIWGKKVLTNSSIQKTVRSLQRLVRASTEVLHIVIAST